MTTEDRVNSLERQVATVAAKVDALINEANQQREDIRRAREKHNADIHELNEKIDSKFDKLSEQMHNMLIGVGGMMVALGAFLVAVLK